MMTNIMTIDIDGINENAGGRIRILGRIIIISFCSHFGIVASKAQLRQRQLLLDDKTVL